MKKSFKILQHDSFRQWDWNKSCDFAENQTINVVHSMFISDANHRPIFQSPSDFLTFLEMSMSKHQHRVCHF